MRRQRLSTDGRGFMRWSVLLKLYRQRLRARVGQEAFAFAGIAVGVALLFSVQVSNASLGHSIADLTHGFVGSAQMQLRARSSDGLDERTASIVARDPDVVAAAPVLQVPANVVGPAGARGVDLLGADERVAGLGGSLLNGIGAAALPGLRAVVVPATVASAVGVAGGVSARLQIAGRTTSVPVAATLGSESVGTLAAAPVVLAPLPYAQLLARARGRVSRIYVRARPGRAEQVRRRLMTLAGDSLDVRPADFDERVFRDAARPNDQSSALYSQVTTLVGFLFALNAMLLMAGDRRRLIAKLLLDGHAPRDVVRLVAVDAVVLGIAASTAGVVLGEALSRFVLTPAPGYLTIGFPVGTARTVDLSAVVTAVAAGLVAALVGTFGPLLVRRSRVSRSSPRGAWRSLSLLSDPEELDSDGKPHLLTARRRWTAAGCLALVAALVVWLLVPNAATAGIALLVFACVMLLPATLTVTLAGVTFLARRSRTPVPALAVGEVRAHGARSVVVAAVAAVAVLASGAIEGARRDLQAGLDTVTHAVNTIADIWISPASQSNQLGVYTFPTEARNAVAGVRDVRHVSIYRGELLTVGARLMWVFAPSADSRELVPQNQIVDGDAQRVDGRLRRFSDAAVSRAFAEQEHLGLGSVFTLPAPRPQRVRIVAITTNIGWPPGAIVVGPRTFIAGWGPAKASALQVQLAPHVPPERARRLVARAVASRGWSGFTVETAAQRERHQRQTSRNGLVRLQQISWLVLAAATLAVAIATGVMILERQRTLARLKLRGFERAQLGAALLLEMAILLGSGCVAGALFALAGTQLLDRWLMSLTGFPVVRSAGGLAALTSLTIVLVGALVLLALPIVRATDAPVELAFEGVEGAR